MDAQRLCAGVPVRGESWRRTRNFLKKVIEMGKMLGDNTGVESVAETTDLNHDEAVRGGDDMATPAQKRTPAFQFYPNDFLGSSKVQRMSLTERGAYITLLSHCWLDHGLPTDLKTLAAILHVKSIQFERMWSGALHECFYEKNGKLQNARLDRERKKQSDFSRRQSDKAHASWESRRNAKSGNAAAMPERHTSGNALQSSSSSSFASSSSEEREHAQESRAIDLDFADFLAAYPPERRKAGYMVQQWFLSAVGKVGVPALFEALNNHKASEQWTVAKKIPGMDTWLKEERWNQRLDPPKGNWGTWQPTEVA
jgi:uncharacterized protein YdaU (DUF1376 family)